MAKATKAKSSESDLGICAVTGSSGWFASSLVSQLTLSGYFVHCLDISEPTKIDPKINAYCKINANFVKYFKCDITNLNDLQLALKGVCTVFHVCAVTDIRTCPSELLDKVNVNGTNALMSAIRKSKSVKQLVYTSSIEVVNDGKIKDNSIEDIPYVFDYNQYGTSKAIAERIVLKSGKNANENGKNDDDFAVCCLRISHIYGPGDPIIFATVNMPFTIGDSNCTHSFIYIENCAYGHIKAAKALAAPETRDHVNAQVFNIKDFDFNFLSFYREVLCEKENMKTLFIPFKIALFLGILYDWIVYLIFRVFGFRTGHPIQSFGRLAVETGCSQHTWNCEKYQKLIGYNPTIDFKESVKRTRDWRTRKYPESSNKKKKKN